MATVVDSPGRRIRASRQTDPTIGLMKLRITRLNRVIFYDLWARHNGLDELVTTARLSALLIFAFACYSLHLVLQRGSPGDFSVRRRVSVCRRALMTICRWPRLGILYYCSPEQNPCRIITYPLDEDFSKFERGAPLHHWIWE